MTKFMDICQLEEPYTLRPDGGWLCISQAMLGDQYENLVLRFVLQYSLKNQPPMLICSLFKNSMHCYQLDLKFEKFEDVIFSISSLRNVQLSSYYLAPILVAIMRSASTGLGDFTIGFGNIYNAKCKENEFEKAK